MIFRHRLADGSIKVVSVYAQPFTIGDQQVLVSSLADMSMSQSPAERHYLAGVEEQVDIQSAELQRARQRARRFWVGSSLVQAVVIILLALVLWRLRKAQRENARLIEELSFRNTELEKLSQAMAHHFQEPSRRLVSFASQLKRQPSEESAAIALHFIDTQAKRLSYLVSDIQRYLGLDTMTMVWEKIAPGALIDEVYQLSDVLAPFREHATLSVEENLPDVWFSRKQFKLLLEVLLHNAWQYRRPDRDLRVVVSSQVADGRVFFKVADNGVGIAPEYRHQVLNMFARLVPNSETHPGTGIGLAIAVKVLRKAQGHIAIEEGIDGGACLVFDLPLSQEK